MNIRIKLFAIARQLAGQESLELELPEGSTVADVRMALNAALPALSELQPHLNFAVNAEYAGDETAIPPGADVACIPPVSGG